MKKEAKKHPKMAEITGPFKIKHRDEVEEVPEQKAEGGFIGMVKNAFNPPPKPKTSPTPAPTPNPKKAKDFMKGFGYAEGGIVEDDIMDEKVEHHKSIAEAIISKRRSAKEEMMSDGGMIDLDETNEEVPYTEFDEMNAEAEDSGLTNDDQPELDEQNLLSGSNKKDMLKEIRSKRSKIR